MSAEKYPHVFAPIRLGPVEVKNRFYFSPHGNPLSVGMGPSDAFAYYYAERAAGGCGLTLHSINVMPKRVGGSSLSPWQEDSIPSFQGAADVVHEHGAKIFGQIHYSRVGNGWRHEANSPMAPLFAPSQVQIFDDFVGTYEMSDRDIEGIIEAHRRSARNLARAGYDGIEVHCSHGMLVEAFLSPYFNRRTDKWGGTPEKRMRFLIECLQAAREGAGADRAIGLRYNADEMMPGGLTQDDTKEVLARLVELGLLDFIDIDIAIEPNQFPLGMPSYLLPKHLYESFVAALKEAAGPVPVLSVLGRVTTIQEAEDAIAAGVADLVGATRGLMAEPNLVKNALEGREEDSRTCIACNICMSGMGKGMFTCAINPATGRERRWGSASFQPATSQKKVVVAGGGPGGLEAARVAALRGHSVVLFERRDRIGGQLELWGRLPGREIFQATPAWYERELNKLGVEVRLGVEANAGAVLAEKPDAVVVATGARYLRTGESGFMEHEIPGWEQDFVYTPEQVIEGGVRPQGRVLVLDEEGFNTGAGVAEMLAEGGAAVEIVTRWLQPVHNMMGTLEFAIELPRLKNLGVEFRPMTYLKAIRNHEVVVFDVFTNIDSTIPDVAAVVMATSRRSEGGLLRELEGQVGQLYGVGDALSPRGLAEAIYEGQRYARLIGEPGAPVDFTEDFFRPVDTEAAQRPASVLLKERQGMPA